MSLRVAVFASGGGSNLQALLDRFNQKNRESAARVSLVISDREGAGALARARNHSVDSTVVTTGNRPGDYIARELLALLDSADIDLVALAGYVQLVPAAVVRKYRNRIINIHPALLPAFGGKGMYGMNVHRAVIASGASVSGATVHMVDENYDEGHIIAQWPVPVLAHDTPEQLATRVLQVEHMIYPAAVEALALARLHDAPPMRFWPDNYAAFTYAAQPTPTEHDIRASLGLE